MQHLRKTFVSVAQCSLAVEALPKENSQRRMNRILRQTLVIHVVTKLSSHFLGGIYMHF